MIYYWYRCHYNKKSCKIIDKLFLYPKDSRNDYESSGISSLLSPNPELSCRIWTGGTTKVWIKIAIIAKVIFIVDHITSVSIELANISATVRMQGSYVFLIPQRRSAWDTFVTSDVYNLKLKALAWDRYWDVHYVEIYQRCSHVISVHHTVCLVTASCSPVGWLLSKPLKIYWTDQVRLPVENLTADSNWISVVWKDNALERNKTSEIFNRDWWV